MAKKRQHEHPDERWLVSYADMITVLMALFIVLFAISVVNKGKFDELAKALKQSFNGQVTDGGKSILSFGSANVTATTRKSAAETPDQIVPEVQQQAAVAQAKAEATREAIDRAKELEAAQDQQLLEAKQHVDATVQALGLQDKVETQINERGLVIRLITDDVLFTVGSSVVRTEALPLIAGVAQSIDPIKNPIRIEGYTDAIPFTNDPLGNVQLSTERAVAVYRALVSSGLDRTTHTDMAPAGFGETHPITANAADGSGPRNRRVEVVVLRRQYLKNAESAAEGPLGVNPAQIDSPELGVNDG